ncbi:MAG TPA: retropepsin-like aspartic protease, partial [Pyrinomonadaceae bacterium]
KERGLLVTAWLNGSGPYVFAVDTGAGMNLISQRVVGAARLSVRTVRPTVLGGLTSATTTSSREAVINELALGDPGNTFRGKTALVVSTLEQDIDGILDPTEVYSPNGFSIDLPNQRLEAIYSTAGDAQRRSVGEGAVVPWLRLGGSMRPFVRLGDGRLALIDTGSGFGLAVNQRNAVIVGGRRNDPRETNHDVGGGTISSRRVSPTTISIGELVLRGVPTDILFGVEDNAPLILGRDALYPFKITFDPQKRLIGFVTSERIEVRTGRDLVKSPLSHLRGQEPGRYGSRF